MPEEIIKSQIIKFARKNLLIGIAMIVGGILGAIIGYALGYIIYIFFIIPFIGLFMTGQAVYHMVSWKSHGIYQNWELYGRNPQIPAVIDGTINNRNSNNDFGSLILSEDWLVFPDTFNFLKYEDINWLYLSTEVSKRDNSPEILVHSVFANAFSAKLLDLKKQNIKDRKEVLVMLFDALKTKAPSLTIGFKKEYKKLWNNDPKDFSTKVKSVG